MQKRDNDFEERLKKCKEEIEEMFGQYDRYPLARRLLKAYLVETLCQMSEQEFTELCKPYQSAVAEVLALCIIMDREEKRSIN